MIRLKRLIVFGSSLLLVGALLFGIISGQLAQAASESQSYNSNTELTIGTVVSTDSPGGNNLELAKLDNEALMVGVVTNTEDSLIDIQPNGSNITIAKTGEVLIIVTDATGDIKSGDNLVISSLSGVATKDTADSKAKKYIAIASESFDANTSDTHTVNVTYADGSTKDVHVGSINAKMNLVDRPPNKNTQDQNFIVALISRLIGKPVNKAKLIAATVVVVTTLLITGVMLQGSIRGSFIALGRNPLSKPLILSNLFRVIAISILILEVGIAVGYIILVA
ncbi:MAG TPA: hypothetical protein VJC09_00975 [Candidatus Saccharimonadales bacterium]|nr:hypothetical protein [Candidatus Saccharimonadales bacterium]